MRSLVGLVLCAALAVAAAQTFPCPSSDSDVNGGQTLAGGYQNVDITDANAPELFSYANMSFVEWVTQDDNFTYCNGHNVEAAALVLSQACSQVVAGTNTALQYLVILDCAADSDTAVEDHIVLDAIVYTPLPTAGSNASPQVTQVWQDLETPAEEVVVEGATILAAPAPAPGPTFASPPLHKITVGGLR